MRRPLVLLDCDGVLADFVTPAFEIANRLFGKDHHPDNLNQWDMARFMGFDSEQERVFYDEIKKKGFHDHLKPYPGAVDGINWIRKIADVHIVTSPMFGETWCSERWKWLHDYFGIKSREVTHTHAKELFFGDVFVDDKPTNVDKWVARHYDSHGLLWHQWYTKDVTTQLTRVHDWHGVMRYVEKKVR